MPIIKEVKLEEECLGCTPPSKDKYGIGTIWECDKCKSKWTLKLLPYEHAAWGGPLSVKAWVRERKIEYGRT